MKAIIYTIFILLTGLSLLSADEPYLILNMANNSKLPKNFRVDTNLNASASGQFSAKSLETMLKVFPVGKRILIVDLRQESHGFADGIAISWRKAPKNWSNLDKTLPEIIQDETSRLKQLATQKVALIHGFLIFPIFVHQTQTEEELAKSLNLNYLRIPVTDHRRPSDAEIDRFILTIRDLPSNSLIHFHCSAGKGRSTAFIVMYDMIKNAKTTAYETILERQHKLGGVNYLASKATTPWKQPDYLSKQDVLKNFYNFCKESDPYTVLWSEWLKKRELKVSAP